ncbi:nitroreductase family protein [Anaerorhabdus furcosa]|uniref:Nitroreductase n=1 Tax=Anaerorhabdus furcosa TaxID=118967 RepID=A0A1T4K9X3_9FIRM|nr:nitroreductase family protein [Anaerorhabdus furcosa]SJZ39254.1 Nitroreductase [Anaerorhabdus furcosa]
MEHIIKIDKYRCIGCKQCINDCPTANIELQAQKAHILDQHCIHCGHCVAICPKLAVTMTGYDNEPIELENPATLSPNDLLMMIRASRSIRFFKNQSVDKSVLQQIIEAGKFSATGSNAQDVSYLVLQDKINMVEEKAIRFFRRILPIAKLFSTSAKRVDIDDHFLFKKAPLVLIVMAKSTTNGMIATTHMALMAEALGLGVLYSGFFTTVAKYSFAVRKALGIKHNDRVVATLVLGYPNVKYHRTTQKEAVEITVL